VLKGSWRCWGNFGGVGQVLEVTEGFRRRCKVFRNVGEVWEVLQKFWRYWRDFGDLGDILEV